MRPNLVMPVASRVAAPQLPVLPLVRCFAGDVQAFLDAGEVTARVIQVVENFDKVDSSKLGPDAVFESLGLDSLDAVEVVMAIEEEFAVDIPDAEADKIKSVGDAVAYITSHPMAK